MNKKFAIVLALALIAIVCCAGCIDPQEPVDPVDPVVPVDPVDPIAPVDPVEPTVEYTVMFMLNYDDAGAYTAETVTAGDAVSKPATPTRSGYTFNGWFTAAEGGAEYDFTLAVNADLTLYAQWNKKSSSSSGSSSGGHSHSYSWKVVTEPNCTAEGQGQYVCSCGQVKSNEAIPATGHLETVEEVNAETGVTEVKCKACGVVLVTIPAGSNNLEIKSVEELKAFADTVNAGTDYSGKTVKLVYDLDLEGEEWTPIGTPDNVFAGIFDGNGKTIRNLQIAGTENVGFFGVLYGTVQNLGLDGVTITGNHYLGAVAGYVKSGSVTGCTVTDAVITATPNAVSGGFDNGDKVGGIVGYGYNGDDGYFSVSGCAVTDSTLTAFRDVGGIVGAANGEGVTDNSVERVNIIVDKVTNKYDNDAVNGNPILGRNLDASTLAPQTESDWSVTIIEAGKLQKVITESKTYYAINDIADLKAFRDYVNAGTSYADETVKLIADINLNDEAWTPIGTAEHPFDGTFDGNEKIISELKVTGTENVGFFGVLYGTVQNLGLDGVTITGNHYLGAVAGYVKSGSVTGCTVTNAVITATPNAVSGGFDNGDKVGGIVGYGYNGDDGSFSVSGCTVTDSTLTAFRDVGGIVGAANGEDVTSNSVDGVKIIVDKVTNKYDNDAVNGNPILGRNLDTSDLGAGQTETDCTISVISDNKESIEDAAAAGADITLADNIEISGNLVMSGGSIDGNQKSIIHNDPSGYDCTITTSGGTIKNLKITGPTTDPSGRAIGPGSSGSYALTENLEISNVEIDYVTYAINGGASNSDLTVTVSDSKINGWISFSGLKEFKFVDCTLGKGNSNYGYIVIYGETVFDGCTFDEFIIGTNDAGFSGASGKSITLIDCYVVVDDQNVKVTADNFVQYLIDTTDSDYEDIIQLNFIVDGTDVSFT